MSFDPIHEIFTGDRKKVYKNVSGYGIVTEIFTITPMNIFRGYIHDISRHPPTRLADIVMFGSFFATFFTI